MLFEYHYLLTPRDKCMPACTPLPPLVLQRQLTTIPSVMYLLNFCLHFGKTHITKYLPFEQFFSTQFMAFDYIFSGVLSSSLLTKLFH